MQIGHLSSKPRGNDYLLLPPFDSFAAGGSSPSVDVSYSMAHSKDPSYTHVILMGSNDISHAADAILRHFLAFAMELEDYQDIEPVACSDIFEEDCCENGWESCESLLTFLPLLEVNLVHVRCCLTLGGHDYHERPYRIFLLGSTTGGRGTSWCHGHVICFQRV